MVRIGLAAFIWATALAGSACAADQPLYEPAPAWVKPVAIPKSPATTDGGPIKVLLYDEQSRFTPEGDAYYSEMAQQILTPQGLEALGNLQQVWDPTLETLAIHRLQIIRDGKVIDLLAGGRKFAVLRRETNLEWAMLDGRLTATFQPEDLRVGDVLDMALTLTRRDPALLGYASDVFHPTYQGKAERLFERGVWSSDLPMRWRQTPGLAAARLSTSGGVTELLLDQTRVETPKPPTGAPPRFGDLGSLEVSQYRDWNELSGLMAPLYTTAATLPPGSAVAREAERIAREVKDPQGRALAALRLVEDQVRYVALAMNGGGLQPARAEDTWSRRFGDCKGKTVMLIALLRAMGIDAEPALVSTEWGDGMDARLPSVAWFDHVIVRAHIDGKTFWLDGTRAGDRALDPTWAPPYRWALPLTVPGAQLARLEPTPLAEPAVDQAFAIDASKGRTAAAPTIVTFTYRGEAAVEARASLASMPRADYERTLRENLAQAYSWLTLTTVDIKDNPAGGLVTLTLTGSARLDWTDVGGGATIYRVPGTAFGGGLAVREPGPGADAPYAVEFPTYSRNTWRIALPAGEPYQLIGADIDRTVAAMALHRRARIENGVLSIESSGRTLAPEFPAAEAEATSAALRELARSDVAVVAQARGSAAAEVPSTAKLAADQKAAEAGDRAAQARLGKRYAAGDGVPTDLAQALAWFRKAAAQGDLEGELQLGQALFYGRGTAPDPPAGAAWFRKAAEAGSAEGQRDMGYLYENGQGGLPRDEAQAIAWFEKAVAQGDSRAQGSLAHMYFMAIGVPRDLPKALALYRKAAAQGNPDAEYTLGMAALSGDGVPKDVGVYRSWMQKAADQGYPLAAFVLGRDMMQGENGAPVDPTGGLALIRRAADQGSVEARAALGYMLLAGQFASQDSDKGLALLTGAANEDYGPAEADLGLVYMAGIGGVPADDGQARLWLQKAADKRLPAAMTNLALLCRTGRGGPIDVATAFHLYYAAADQGWRDAEDALGDMYLNGLGTKADPAAAMVWLQAAAAQGSLSAARLVASLYASGRGIDPDETQAAYWFRKAADAGDVLAMASLGWMYIHGSGVPVDGAKAAELLRKAADAGVADAQSNLGFLYDHGLGVPQDLAEAMAWYAKAAAQGHSMGQVNVGFMYHQGRGVPRDDITAIEQFRKAADQGNMIGERLLGIALLNGEGAPQDVTSAKLWLQRAAQQGDAEASKALAQIP